MTLNRPSNPIPVFLPCANPHNPVGRVYSRQELEAIAEICIKHDLYVCSDDMHSDLVYSGHQHTPIASLHPEIAKRSITIMAPSKTFNIAGLDCAFAIITDKDLRNRFLKAQKGLFGRVNLLGQVAAEAAYTHGQPWLKEMLVYLESNRDYIVSFVNRELADIQMTSPEGTFFGMVGLPSNTLCQECRCIFFRTCQCAGQ